MTTTTNPGANEIPFVMATASEKVYLLFYMTFLVCKQ